MSDIYIIEWNNESGDRGTLGYWTTKPTATQVKQILAEFSPNDVVDGEFLIYGEVQKLSAKELPGKAKTDVAEEHIHLAIVVTDRQYVQRSRVTKLATKFYDELVDRLGADENVRAVDIYEVKETLLHHHKTYAEDFERFANSLDSNGNFVDIPATPSKLLDGTV